MSIGQIGTLKETVDGRTDELKFLFYLGSKSWILIGCFLLLSLVMALSLVVLFTIDSDGQPGRLGLTALTTLTDSIDNRLGKCLDALLLVKNK